MYNLENTENLITLKDEKNDNGFKFLIQMMRRLLKLLGIWPLMSSTYPKILRRCVIVIILYLLLFALIPFSLHMIFVEKNIKVLDLIFLLNL